MHVTQMCLNCACLLFFLLTIGGLSCSFLSSSCFKVLSFFLSQAGVVFFNIQLNALSGTILIHLQVRLTTHISLRYPIILESCHTTLSTGEMRLLFYRHSVLTSTIPTPRQGCIMLLCSLKTLSANNSIWFVILHS